MSEYSSRCSSSDGLAIADGPLNIYKPSIYSPYVAQLSGIQIFSAGRCISRANGAICESLDCRKCSRGWSSAFQCVRENIRVDNSRADGAVQFEGFVQPQAFHGATEMVRVESSMGWS